MKTLLTLSLATLMLSSGAVMAQDQQLFDRLDADGNDKLSFTDLRAQFPDLTQDAFDAADLDSDDYLDLSQFGALQNALTAGAGTEVAVAGSTGSGPLLDIPAFDLIDKDANGKVSFDDLTSVGVTQEQFDLADIDNDDFLDQVQYGGLKSSMVAPAARTGVKVGMAEPAGDRPDFALIDVDGDGMVDFSDLKVQWPDLTQEQFDVADIDNDDYLDQVQYEGLVI